MPMKRISRACLRCRQRKSKCDLDSFGPAGIPPCQRCVRNGTQCILGGSRRGGRRVRRVDNLGTGISSPSDVIEKSPSASGGQIYGGPFNGLSPSSAPFNQHQYSGLSDTFSDRLSLQRNESTPSVEDTFASTGLHDTTDALNFLSQVAENASHQPGQFRGRIDNGFTSQMSHMSQSISNQLLEGQYLGAEVVPYRLITAGLLTVAQVAGLVSR
jgi:Fungal Zn(2)-Cys(6) binuclear cluster domain